MSLVVAILPVFLILLYVYYKDKEKESKQLLIKLFFLGILSAIPAIILEFIFVAIFGDDESLHGVLLIFYAFVGVALIEEFCKWLLLYKDTYNHREFDHIYDAVVYACFVSLGFAFFENVFYVFSYGIKTGLFRAISSIPGHACFGVIMGNYFGLAKIADINGDKQKHKRYLMLSVLLPTLLHGLYDYCLISDSTFLFIIFLMFIVIIYIYSVLVIKKLSNVRENFIQKNTSNNKECGVVCPNCGKLGYGIYCANCGKKLLDTNSVEDNK